ncbi:unnamed protein product [Ectocarpus sp. CCAP 1310/34]|nr:unnamed protein product [Ectocarpus sp. CCAP 1310/34]
MDGFAIFREKKRKKSKAPALSTSRQGEEALLTSGPYGYGSRAFAKVVETVTARLETRLAAAGGDRAAAAAVAGKVNEAWRDMYNRPLPSEAEVMHRILTVAPADARPSRRSSASSDLWRSTGAWPQTASLPRKNEQSIATADAATATRTPKRKFVLKAIAANKRHRVGSTNAVAAARVNMRRANTAATAENDPTAERRRVAAAPTQGADGRVSLAAGAGARPNSGSGEIGGGEKTAAGAQGRAVAQGGGGGAEPPREKEATNGPRLEQAPPSSSGSATNSAAPIATAAAAAAAAAAPTPSSHGEGREKQVTITDECAEAAPAGQGRTAQADGRQPATAIGDEPARDEERGADEFDLGPKKSSSYCGVQSSTIRGGDGNQVDGGGGSGGGGEGCGSEAGADKPKEASSSVDEEDGRKEEADSTVPDVIVTANYVGKFLKNRTRQKWKLKLEGGAIEGEGLVFVFDECNCNLDPFEP